MFTAAADRVGIYLRTTHYYEPSYREADLPARTDIVRPLPGIDLNEDEQLQLLGRCRFADELRSIPVEKLSDKTFGYDNGMYEHGDADMLYNMIRMFKPARIVEIGSGQSTLMARLAIDANRSEDADYICDHTCIEPYEMAWLEEIGVRVVRDRVENVDLSVFGALQANDLLFIDSSHVIRPWGDVLREMNEIIPSVASGVLIHIHDIFTPRDYPETWLRSQRRLWNEQYLLEAFLCYNMSFKVLCAMNWLKHEHLAAVSAACPMLTVRPDAEPGAFWITKR